MSDENNMKPPSLWIPMNDAMDLAALGKLCEEAGELCAAISRCIIQGMNEHDPVTMRMNRNKLEDELADVHALSLLVIDRFNLNQGRIGQRAMVKLDHKLKWIKMLDEAIP